MTVSKKIIQGYLESQGENIVSLRKNSIIKKKKIQKVILPKQGRLSEPDFIRLENNCDSIIKNIDKLIKLLE